MRVEDIKITEVEVDEPLTFFKGTATVDNYEVSFEGVLFKSVGGPNVNVKLDDESRNRLRENGVGDSTIEEIETNLQLRILEGEMEMIRHGNRG